MRFSRGILGISAVCFVLAITLSIYAPAPHAWSRGESVPIPNVPQLGSPAGSAHSSLVRYFSNLSSSGSLHPSASSIGRVQQTLDLENGSLISGNYRPVSCYGFQDLAVAPALERVFVTCSRSDALMAFNVASGVSEGSVRVGPSPMGVVFDSDTNRVYVAASDGVDVVASSNMTLLHSVPAGSYPIDLAYDNATHRLYVSDYSGDNVTVISTTNDSTIASIPLASGAEPWGVAYNPFNRDVYVAESGRGVVGIISTANNTLASSVNVSGQPIALAINSVTGTVYATLNSNQLTAISGSSNGVVGTTSLPGSPSGVAFDRITNRVFVATDNVTVINASSLTITANIVVGTGPVAIETSDVLGRAYVADYGSSDVAEIGLSSTQVLGYIRSDPGPQDLAWNGFNTDVYVTNHASGTLIRVDGQTNTITSSNPVSYGLTGIASDSLTGHLFVASSASGRVYDANASGVVVSSARVGDGPMGVAYDSKNEYVYSANYGSNNVSVINGSTGSVVGSISLPLVNGAFPGELENIVYDPTNGYLFLTVNGCFCFVPGNVTVINGSTNQVVGSISYWPTGGPFALAIDAQNNELYVTDTFGNAVWAFNASTLAFVSATPVGFSPEGVAVDPLNGYVYVTNFGSSNVSVIDPSTHRVIGSIEVGMAPLGVVFDPANGDVYVANEYSGTLSIINAFPYTVTFTETGLPLGTSWKVTLGGVANWSAAPEISFVEPNGTFQYSVGLVAGWHLASFPRTGSLTINGSSVTENLAWILTTYNVSFSEAGLPPGTNWSVTMGNSSRDSTSSVIGFVEPNGTYSYSIAGIPGWHLVSFPRTGTVAVSGSSVEKLVNWTVTTYSVTLSESGLPAGTSWGVTFGGVNRSTNTSTITFTEVNDSYSFTVGDVPGYRVSPGSGMVLVNGRNVTQSVNFSSTHVAGQTFLGLPFLEGVELLLAMVIVAGLVVGLLVIRFRRRRKQLTGSAERSSTAGDQRARGRGKESR